MPSIRSSGRPSSAAATPAADGGVGEPERGSAVADFAMVAGLLALVFAAVVQLGLALHVRNTLIWCASEGARLAARANSRPEDGAARARELISASFSAGYDAQVGVARGDVAGVQVVEVSVEAPLPLLGLFGPARAVTVSGRAFAEDQR